MPPPNPSMQATAFADLTRRLDDGFKELKTMLGAIEERLRKVEQKEAGCYPAIDERLKIIERIVEKHTDEILLIQNYLSSQRIMNLILGFIASTFGILVIGLLYDIFTNKIELFFH